MDNYIENEKWRKAAGLAFWGVSIQSVFSLICLAVGLYLAYNMVDILLEGIMPSLVSGCYSYYENRLALYGGVIGTCSLLSLTGYFCYLAGICMFKVVQTSDTAQLNTRTIMIVELIMPILLILYLVIYHKGEDVIFDSKVTAFIYNVLPFLGSLAAVIILRNRYGALVKDESWSDIAKVGARDIKSSYSLILWMILILFLCIIFIAFTTWHYVSSLHDMRYSAYEYDDMYEGFNSFTKMSESFVSTIKFETLFFSLVLFGLSLTSVIKRAIGWRKIQAGGDEETYPSSGIKNFYPERTPFCHKCGSQLPEGAAFCPVCGTAVMIVSDPVAEQTVADAYAPDTSGHTEQDVFISDVYEEETPDRKKWFILGGIAAGIILIAVTLLTLCGRSDKYDEEDLRVYEDEEYGSEIEDDEEATDEDVTDEKVTDEDVTHMRLPKADSYYEDPAVLGQTSIELNGKIDGKYRINLELNMEDDHTVHGIIMYKYNIPIELSGKWSEIGYGDKKIVVHEYTDGKMTGTFSGRFDGSTYNGTWRSPDGKRQMPFTANI